ncbi:hypothetical protein [Achromobacter aloeverae]
MSVTQPPPGEALRATVHALMKLEGHDRDDACVARVAAEFERFAAIAATLAPAADDRQRAPLPVFRP